MLEEVPVLTPGPDGVLIRVEAASICGTDLHIDRWDEWSSERVKPPPAAFRHELCGMVVALGSGGLGRRGRGTRLGREPCHVRGLLHFRTGRAHMCERTRILGVDRDGGFADYVAVPASVVWHNDRAKLPPEIACLQEPFGNAVFATSTCRSSPGGRSQCPGCGPVGLKIAIARAFGAGRLLGLGHRPLLPELAKSLGADAVVDVTEVDDVPPGSSSRTRGIGMGVVFEMSGALKAIEDAFRIVRHGGNVVLFDPGEPGDDRGRRRVADLQEPHRLGRQRARDLGDLVHDAAGCSSTASSTSGR